MTINNTDRIRRKKWNRKIRNSSVPPIKLSTLSSTKLGSRYQQLRCRSLQMDVNTENMKRILLISHTILANDFPSITWRMHPLTKKQFPESLTKQFDKWLLITRTEFVDKSGTGKSLITSFLLQFNNPLSSQKIKRTLAIQLSAFKIVLYLFLSKIVNDMKTITLAIQTSNIYVQLDNRN